MLFIKVISFILWIIDNIAKLISSRKPFRKLIVRHLLILKVLAQNEILNIICAENSVLHNTKMVYLQQIAFHNRLEMYNKINLKTLAKYTNQNIHTI
jgi:hypothetical protein